MPVSKADSRRVLAWSLMAAGAILLLAFGLLFYLGLLGAAMSYSDAPETAAQVNARAVESSRQFYFIWGVGLVALALIGAGIWTLLHRRRIGLCADCGYDRTGLAAGAVCPVCGASPALGP